MKRIGFIGYGSMGSLLVNGWLATGVFKPGEMIVANRSLPKLKALEEKWAGVRITGDNREAARESDLLFLCVKPLEVLPVLRQIQGDIQPGTHLVSIAACVGLKDIEGWFPGAVTKVTPSLTAEVREGITLLCHNEGVSKEQKQTLEGALGKISRVAIIKESDFEAAADLTSCAPGLFAAMMENFVQAGLRHSELSPEDARMMVVTTLFGTAKLMAEKQLGFQDMIQRVATKGGITEEGVKVLNDRLPGVFDEVFHHTLKKHAAVKRLIAGKD